MSGWCCYRYFTFLYVHYVFHYLDFFKSVSVVKFAFNLHNAKTIKKKLRKVIIIHIKLMRCLERKKNIFVFSTLQGPVCISISVMHLNKTLGIIRNILKNEYQNDINIKTFYRQKMSIHI